MSNNSDDFFERLHQARAHGAMSDLVGRRLDKVLWCDPNDSLARQLVEARLRRVQQDLRSGNLPPFPQARLFAGDLILGQDFHDSPIRIMLDWLCSGLLTVANTGSGKSNLVYWILSQLAFLTNSVSAWIFEPYKTQLRRLRPFYHRAGKPLVILPWQNWRYNLLQIQDGDVNSHTATVVDLLVRTLDLPGRAAAILRQAIHDLYIKFGVYDSTAAHFPTLFDLHEKIRAQQDLNVAGKEAILDRLGAFLVALTPACGAWRQGWLHRDLTRFNIVFEMRGAAESVRSLLPQSLLFSVFHSRITRGLVNTPLELLLVCDDGQRIFSDRLSTSGEMSPLDELAGIVRGAGIGLWPIVQTTIGFSRRLRPNLAIKIFGRLGCHEDYATMAADCGLSAEQLDYIKLKLIPGAFVGLVAIGNHTQPFIFRVPLAALPPAPTEAEVQQSQNPLAVLPTEFAAEFVKWSPHPVVEVNTQKAEAAPILSDTERRLLEAVVKEPGKSVTYYCRLARLNGKRFADIRQRLVTQGFIREHRVAMKSRGRSAIILEPLASAIHAAQKP